MSEPDVIRCPKPEVACPGKSPTMLLSFEAFCKAKVLGVTCALQSLVNARGALQRHALVIRARMAAIL